MFGRPSRRDLHAMLEEQRAARAAAERDATLAAQPRWRRTLRGMPIPLAVLAAAAVGAAAGCWLLARAWWTRWPRPVTAAALPAAAWAGTWQALTIATAAVAAAAWRHHHLTTVRPAVVDVPDLADGDVALWRAVVADGRDAPVPGSTVADDVTVLREDPADHRSRRIGVGLHITGATSQQHPAYVRSQIPRIAAHYARSKEAISVHSVGDDRRCRVEILDQWWMEELAERARIRDEEAAARLRQVWPWRPEHALDLDTGRLILSHAAVDGSPVRVQVFVPGEGASHVWMVGATRRGKSSCLGSLIQSIMSTGRARLHLVDLKGGASVPEWIPHAASYAGDPAAARVMLGWVAEHVLGARLRAMGAQGLKVVDPSPEWSIELVVVDEAQDIARDEQTMRHVDRIARQGAGALVILVWITQVGTIDAAFGKFGTSIREQIQAGTVIAFWTGATTRSLALGGPRGDIDLSCIPQDVKGACVIDGPASGRALGRAVRIADADAQALADEACGGPATEPPLDAAAMHAAMTPPTPPAATTAAGDVTTPAADAKPEARIRAVLAAHGVGVMVRTGQILTEADVRSSTFDAAIKRLQSRGLVVDLGIGQWAATAALIHHEKEGNPDAPADRTDVHADA
jgi:hypothetical protein